MIYSFSKKLLGVWGLFGSYRTHDNYVKTHPKFPYYSDNPYYFTNDLLVTIGGFVIYTVPPLMLYSIYKELCTLEDSIRDRR